MADVLTEARQILGGLATPPNTTGKPQSSGSPGWDDDLSVFAMAHTIDTFGSGAVIPGGDVRFDEDCGSVLDLFPVPDAIGSSWFVRDGGVSSWKEAVQSVMVEGRSFSAGVPNVIGATQAWTEQLSNDTGWEPTVDTQAAIEESAQVCVEEMAVAMRNRQQRLHVSRESVRLAGGRLGR
tara:strand:+ start:2138 stop:2677 length:540 start_codon:yes stop_codon:yes gene_type:complete